MTSNDIQKTELSVDDTTINIFANLIIRFYYKKMIEINTNKIAEAVCNLCLQANTLLDKSVYDSILKKYTKEIDSTKKTKIANILKNAQLAYKTKMPLCQDTGQVIVFVELGQNVKLTDRLLSDAINNGIEKAYKENYFRKSVVQNTLFNRKNTGTNTPAIIYTDVTDTDFINIKLLVKGAGSENYGQIKMFTPSAKEEEIFEFIKETILKAGEKSCPPLTIGIGAGGTLETAALLSKKAFFNKDQTQEEQAFIDRLKKHIDNICIDVLDIKLCSTATHIACCPIAVTINCHSVRHAQCHITDKEISYESKTLNFKDIKTEEEAQEVFTHDIEKIKSLKAGEKILLTGEVYTARDAAHKKIAKAIQNKEQLPFDLNNKIIFYAGPCPAAEGKVIGSIGPTTSTRMDEFLEIFHKNGMLASIGKGERTQEAKEITKKYLGKYFTAQGGIACLLAQCVKKSEIIAYQELGTEAVRKLYVGKLPVTVEI